MSQTADSMKGRARARLFTCQTTLDGRDECRPSFIRNRPASADIHQHPAFIEETSDSVLAVGNWDLASKPRLNPSKYVSLSVRKYRQICRQLYACLRRQMRLHLDNELCLDLSDKLHTEFNRRKFEKLFRQLFRTLFASLFGSLFVLK